VPTASTYLPGEGKYSKEKLTANIVPEYIPITENALIWNGWGTGLKPAHEPVMVGSKI
jgi:hypothetical protein